MAEPNDALSLRALIVKEKKKVLKHQYSKGKVSVMDGCILVAEYYLEYSACCLCFK